MCWFDRGYQGVIKVKKIFFFGAAYFFRTPLRQLLTFLNSVKELYEIVFTHPVRICKFFTA